MSSQMYVLLDTEVWLLLTYVQVPYFMTLKAVCFGCNI